MKSIDSVQANSIRRVHDSCQTCQYRVLDRSRDEKMQTARAACALNWTFGGEYLSRTTASIGWRNDIRQRDGLGFKDGSRIVKK